MFRRARQDYGTTGIDSKYFKLCDTVNRLLEELQVSLGQRGVHIKTVEGIVITPDVFKVDLDLSRIASAGYYRSPDTYFDVNKDRIEVNKCDDWYEERGLFGIVVKKPRLLYTYAQRNFQY